MDCIGFFGIGLYGGGKGHIGLYNSMGMMETRMENTIISRV